MTRQTGIILALVALALAAYGGEWYLNKRSARIAARAVAPTRMVDVQQMPAMPVFQPGWTETIGKPDGQSNTSGYGYFVSNYYTDPLSSEFRYKILDRPNQRIHWYQGKRTDTRSAEELLSAYPYIDTEEALNIPGFDAYFIQTTEMANGIAIIQNKDTRMVLTGHGVLDLLEEYVTPEDAGATGGKKPAISGNFVTSGKYGAVHSVTGGVVVSESSDTVEIRLSEDFAVSDAPDMYVWLYPKQDSADPTATTRKLDLGPLVRNSGPATYRVTKSEFDQYGATVVIWCKEFNVEIARATLNDSNLGE